MSKYFSPFVKSILNSNINWIPFSEDNLQVAIRENKIILMCICPPGRVLERYDVKTELSKPKIYKTITSQFYPMVLDSEDEPALRQIGIDMLYSTHQEYSLPIYLFFSNKLEPIICIPSLEAIDITQITLETTRYIKSTDGLPKELDSWQNKTLLTTEDSTSIIDKKREKALHIYVKDWEYKKLHIDSYYINEAYTTCFCALASIIQYYHKYNKHNELNALIKRIDSLYFSQLYDPIESGFFSQALIDTPKFPLYEKKLTDNCSAAILYSHAYNITKEARFKDYTIDIVEFIENNLKAKKGGYNNLSTINCRVEESKYYTLSIKELKSLFPKSYSTVTMILNIRTDCNQDKHSEIENTPLNILLSKEHINILKQRRAKKEFASELELDERVIFANNCYLASALCIIAINIPETKDAYIARAKEIIDFISSYSKYSKEGVFRYLTPDGEIHTSSNSLDHAQYVEALLHLYKVTNKDKYLNKAIEHTEYLIENYYNTKSHLFSICNKELPNPTLYPTETLQDLEYRSENSVIANNLIKLHQITENNRYKELYTILIEASDCQMYRTGPNMSSWIEVYLELLSK